jgi:8-oxo-dGTP diphosphatase
MPELCVGGILLRGGAILLGKRSASRRFYPNVWDVFGGHSEPHERPEETLVRELHEELGIVPVRFRLLDMVSDLEPEPGGAPSLLLYLVTDWEGVPANLVQEEHSEIGWFTPGGALQLDLAHPDYLSLFRRLAEPGEL